VILNLTDNQSIAISLPALKDGQRLSLEESNNNLFFFVSIVLPTDDSRKPCLESPLHFSAFDGRHKFPIRKGANPLRQSECSVRYRTLVKKNLVYC
jgi:hypothetical protein